ncbi:hypothetical protein FACS1894217_01580 [Clostridia bacterium]|nr:hypothetical protein FACS1894217_01580 [Clostridia bacterium]
MKTKLIIGALVVSLIVSLGVNITYLGKGAITVKKSINIAATSAERSIDEYLANHDQTVLDDVTANIYVMIHALSASDNTRCTTNLSKLRGLLSTRTISDDVLIETKKLLLDISENYSADWSMEINSLMNEIVMPDGSMDAPPNISLAVGGRESAYKLDKIHWNNDRSKEVLFADLARDPMFAELQVVASQTSVSVKFDSQTPDEVTIFFEVIESGSDGHREQERLYGELVGNEFSFKFNPQEWEKYRDREPVLCGVHIYCGWEDADPELRGYKYSCNYLFLIRIQF